MEQFYKDTNNAVNENDIVFVKHNNDKHQITQINGSVWKGTVALINMNTWNSGYYTYPIKDLKFIEREFYDCEEIMS